MTGNDNSLVVRDFQFFPFIRNLHPMSNKYSEFLRFTVPMKLIKMFQKNQLEDSFVVISIIDNKKRVKIDRVHKHKLKPVLIETYQRSLINNNDGTFRTTIDRDIYYFLIDTLEENFITINLKGSIIIFQKYVLNETSTLS